MVLNREGFWKAHQKEHGKNYKGNKCNIGNIQESMNQQSKKKTFPNAVTGQKWIVV